jgi:hypothetical protein
MQFDTNEIIFVMPIYSDGSEGLIGSNVESFYNLIHQFNSRIKGGCFTKYTYDDSHAPVFIHHLPLSKMNFNWFKSTLDYFLNIFTAFRPLFDQAISDFGLRFIKTAGMTDDARKYVAEKLGKESPFI